MQDPLFLIWLGTCDLMKIGARKRISLRGKEIPQLRAALLEMKTKVLAINKSSTVIFLRCPIYLIVKWNESRNFEVQESDGSDGDLEGSVKSLNEVIVEINNFYTPKFSLDILKNTKT